MASTAKTENLNVQYGRVRTAARARESAIEARNAGKLIGSSSSSGANTKTRNEAQSPSATTTMRPVNKITSTTSTSGQQQASKSISTCQKQQTDQIKSQETKPVSRAREIKEEETNPKEIYAQAARHHEVNEESDEENEDHHCQHHHHNHYAPRLATDTHHAHHKPHCVHHNPNCLKHGNHASHHPVHHHHHQSSPTATTRGLFVDTPHKWRSQHPIKPPDHPYLLVQYRPPNGSQVASMPSATMDMDGKRRRSTAGFISQLYFLLHLSAIISLLLHHNNLVSSERKHLIYRHSQTGDSVPDSNGPPNGSSHYPSASEPPSVSVAHEETHRPLPVPQMLAVSSADTQRVVSSYLPTSVGPQTKNLKYNHRVEHPRVARNLNYLLPNHLPAQSDLLVRLVGWWHAKHALQYLLCYLLSSSIAILICLWLLRLCDARRAGSPRRSHGGPLMGRKSAIANRSNSNQIPYYRTRLADCTPVLIGSISLGLIQLIVVGLDIAGNVDWLSSPATSGSEHHQTAIGQPATRWPVYLPLLHFAFVSLLMQFILAQVAKNHELEDKLAEQQESGERPPHLISSAGNAADFAYQRRRKLAALSINNTTNQLAASLSSSLHNSNNSNSNNRQQDAEIRMPRLVATSSSSPISVGLQNIALAHLLVTHILLWLMKLNSISLFQPIEQQQFQFHSRHHNGDSRRATSSPPPLLAPSLPPGLHKINARNNNTQPPSLPTTSTATTGATSGEFEADNHLHHLYHSLRPVPVNEPPTQASTSTEFKSNDRLLSMPPPPVIQQVDDAAYERERQMNRTKLENILRRKVPRVEHHVTSTITPKTRLFPPSTSPPPPIFAAGEPTSAPSPLPSAPSHRTRVYQSAGSETGVSVASDSELLDEKPVKVVVPLIGHEDAPPIASVSQTSHNLTGYNQRGLRSTARGMPTQVSTKPSQSTSTTTTTSTNSPEDLDWTRVEDPPSKQRDQNDNSTTVTMTRAELMNLINSVKQQTSGSVVENSQVKQLQQQQQQPANLTTTYKSSLPKRMTAFRQSIRPKILTSLPPTSTTTTTTTVSPATTEYPAPRSSPKMQQRSPASTTKPAAPSYTSSSTTTSPPVKVKQKAKIVISRKENDKPEVDLSSVIPTRGNNDSDRSIRNSLSKTSESSSNDSTSTTDRPFPSVESDPPEEDDEPPSTTTTRRPPSSSSTPTPSTKQPARSTKGSTLRPPDRELVTRDPEDVPSPAPPIAGDASNIADDEDSGNGGGSDDNGDSSGPEIGGESEESEIDLDALLPPVPNYNDTDELPAPKYRDGRRLNETGVTNSKVTVPLSSLEDDTSVFNEAASTETPSFVATIKLRIGGPDSRSEKLVMSPNGNHNYKQHSQQRQDDSSPQPTFAEYLLPIVHQYHILIIAILFHMWLDSLYRQRRLQGKREADARRHNEHVLLGPSSGQHNARRLIAIPIGPDGKPKLKVETNQLLGNKTFLNSHQLARLAGGASGARILDSRVHHSRHRSRSMDHLCSQLIANDELNNSSGLSRHNSMRSSSSEQLLWLPPYKLTRHQRRHGGHRSSLSPHSFGSAADSTSDSTASDSQLSSVSFAKLVAAAGRNFHQNQQSLPPLHRQTTENKSSSVCSIFFGLLIVSASLIVMLLGIDLLSLVTQCLTQVLSILVCLLGLCVVWRHRKRVQTKPSKQLARRASRWANRRLRPRAESREPAGVQQPDTGSHHRQVFHYLFLLAAYYCGLATALNLGEQNATEQQLFTQQVIQFVQRHWSAGQPVALLQEPIGHINYTLLFHLVVALKGLILVVQVTLQTVLIRMSSWRQSKCELRQIYTFLMFANLSLWAMDICEQQQHLQQAQQHQLAADQMANGELMQFELLTLDGFTRFASSIVTLSHLYHGLVFMQQ